MPGDPTIFIIELSERLAEFAPQLTLDFISEVAVSMAGMEKTEFIHRISCLRYLSPWIKNLGHMSNPTHPLYERSGSRLRDGICVLADLAVTQPEVCFCRIDYLHV